MSRWRSVSLTSRLASHSLARLFSRDPQVLTLESQLRDLSEGRGGDGSDCGSRSDGMTDLRLVRDSGDRGSGCSRNWCSQMGNRRRWQQVLLRVSQELLLLQQVRMRSSDLGSKEMTSVSGRQVTGEQVARYRDTGSQGTRWHRSGQQLPRGSDVR